MTTLIIVGDIAFFIGGAVVYHFFATKVLGYAKQAADKVASKL